MDVRIKLIQEQIDCIQGLMQQHYDNIEIDKWDRKTERVLSKIFGVESKNVEVFSSISYTPIAFCIGGDDDGSSTFQSSYIRGLTEAKGFLESCIEEIEEEQVFKELEQRQEVVIPKIEVNTDFQLKGGKMKKKLQVFISSTYTDLIEDRQLAVEAILEAGHIPAGMELFKSGKSQMETIKRWIDESDVYMLILGGRYGSIESESGKSYTHLEYEYAIEKGMPVFAVVIDDDVLKQRIQDKLANGGEVEDIREIDNVQQYKGFKKYVLSNICGFVKDAKDVKYEVHKQLNDIAEENNLIGWIRADDFNRLLKENLEVKNNSVPNNERMEEQLSKLTTLISRLVEEKNQGNHGTQRNKATTNRVLWVDDYPSNNDDIIEYFSLQGIGFDLAINTTQGVNFYNANEYGLIITDMGRGNESDAGIKFINEIILNGTKKNRPPIIVYASNNAIKKFGEMAYNAGANLVTNDVIVVMGEIAKL